MKLNLRTYARLAYAALAVALLSVVLLPTFASKVFAYGQVTTRSIKLSDSTPGATGISYLVAFTPATTATSIAGIVVDFCSSDPLPGDPCTQPSGFTVGTPTVTGVTITGQSGGSWSASSANSGRTLELSNSGSITGTPSGTASFTLTTATNPAAPAGTFYGRIFTFNADTDPAAWVTDQADGSSTLGVVDAGGTALSTATSIGITAKVQEQLSFCVSGSAITANDCANTLTAPNLILGHDNGSGTLILDATLVDTEAAYTAASTNATTGLVVRMKDTSTSTCGGLSDNGGTSCFIPSANTGTTTGGQTISAGTAAFGMCVLPGSANTTPQSPYDNSGTFSNCSTTPTGSQYGMDEVTASTTKVISTYGSPIFSSTGPLTKEGDTLIFAATASNTTPAGTYTVNESLVATGTF